jgi:hypothetical protein
MGDFNFVTNPAIDCIPAEVPKASESADALSALSDHLGGLLDAFHGAARAHTHTTTRTRPKRRSEATDGCKQNVRRDRRWRGIKDELPAA